MHRLAASLAVIVLSLSAAAQAEPIVQTVEEHRNDRGEIDRGTEGFVHRQSGYFSPQKLGDMPARKTYTYGPGDGSLYYTLLGGANGDPWLSLYVYPAKLDLAAEAASVGQSLVEAMPGSAIAPPQGLPPAGAGFAEKWFDATVDGTAVLTGFRLVRSGSWFVKVRLTIPKSGGQAALDRAARGLAAVPWTIPVKSDAPQTAAIGR